MPPSSTPKLLGGSSKLAKLAEERRKKAAAASSGQAQQSTASEPVSSLDRLMKPQDKKENAAPSPGAEAKRYPIRKRKSATPPPRTPSPPPEEPKEEAVDLRSSPTAFGKALSTSTEHNNGTSRMTLHDLMGSSYSASPFEGPSPDDTVIKAQDRSKGLKK